MTGVQKGGVEKTPQTDIKDDVVRNRSVSDHGFFKIYKLDDEVDGHIFRKTMKVGTFHYIFGDRGNGKTHLMVNLMNMLAIGFDDCGDNWEIITNVFFYHKDQDGKITDGAPERIHHVDNLEGILEKIDELSKENRRIAIFLDDVDRFYTKGDMEGLSPYIRKLIINRRKMRLLLCFATEDENFDFEFGRYMPTCCDYQWMKTDARDWARHLTEVDIKIDWNNLQESFLEPYGYYMYTSAVDWADKKKDSGWYFDYEGDSSVLRYSKAFDFNQFWRGLENVSSISVPNYLHGFLSKSTECKDIHEQHKDGGCMNDNVHMAVKLKSIGLTDEAIEYLLGIPKTTLRRHADKLGYRWKVGSIESPFRFKRINGNENEETSR